MAGGEAASSPEVDVPEAAAGRAKAHRCASPAEAEWSADGAMLEQRGVQAGEGVMRSPVNKYCTTAQREASPVQRETFPAQQEDSPVIKYCTTVQREASPVERETLPVQRDGSPVGKYCTTVQPEASPVQREASPA